MVPANYGGKIEVTTGHVHVKLSSRFVLTFSLFFSPAQLECVLVFVELNVDTLMLSVVRENVTNLVDTQIAAMFVQ